jgi:hypothetical protein
MSGSFREGVTDTGRSIYANIGDTYQAALRGETAPHATMTGTMEQTVMPGEEPTQSYSAALLQNGVEAGKEAEADHWRQYELDQAELDNQAPEPDADPQEPDIG